MKSPSLYTILKLELLNFVEFINDNGEPNDKNKKSK